MLNKFRATSEHSIGEKPSSDVLQAIVEQDLAGMYASSGTPCPSELEKQPLSTFNKNLIKRRETEGFSNSLTQQIHLFHHFACELLLKHFIFCKHIRM